MNRLMPALFTLVLLNGSLFGFQVATDWLKYDSPEGGYSVLLPTQPRLSTGEAANASGEKFQQHMAIASDANAVFLIGYYDYVPATTFSLDKARDSMVLAVKGTLVKEASISLGDSPGREFKIAATRADGVDYLVRARIYDTGTRVFVLQFLARATDDTAAAEKAAKYFDSFKAIKAP